MYERIMVPLDGSEFSERALPMARSLAGRTGAALHIVTVFEPIAKYSGSNWEAATLEWGEAYLEDIAGHLRAEIDGRVTTALIQGQAVESLSDEARAVGADLTVMATHGRGSIARAWIGSVADEYSRTHDGLVLLVRPGDSMPADSNLERAFGRADILVPLDGSELSEEALAHAVELGERCESRLHLTRVVASPPVLASSYLPDTARATEEVLGEGRAAAAEYLEAHADRLRRRGLEVTTAVEVDHQPANGILREADAVGADFIVMATHGYRGIRRALLGSTADKVLRASNLPLLLYRPADVPRRAAS